MKHVIIRERMTRDEMFRRYPDKYLIVLDEEGNIGQLSYEAGKLTGFVEAVFDTLGDACKYSSDITKNANERRVMWPGDYTEEVFNLGFVFFCS